MFGAWKKLRDCWLDLCVAWRDFAAVNRFLIKDSFALHPDFVFAGSLIEGQIKAGMVFEVPEAGHKWRVVVKAVEFLDKSDGEALIGLRVHNANYLHGLGVGFTTELLEPND